MIAQPRPFTPEERAIEEKRHKQYDYYGIPYLVFGKKETPKQVEKDWSEATLLILGDKPIPKDLEQRLLSYKEQGLHL